jgi:hypothetical protein
MVVVEDPQRVEAGLLGPARLIEQLAPDSIAAASLWEAVGQP